MDTLSIDLFFMDFFSMDMFFCLLFHICYYIMLSLLMQKRYKRELSNAIILSTISDIFCGIIHLIVRFVLSKNCKHNEGDKA